MPPLILITIGLLGLFLGSGWLVNAGIVIWKHLKLSPLIIGMTVVAWGTSMPELFVAIQAAYGGNPLLGVGNGVGSNIANIGLVLGISLVFFMPENPQWKVKKRDKAFFLGSPALLWALFQIPGGASRDFLIAICLLGLLGLYHVYLWKTGRGADVEAEPAEEGQMPLWLAALLALAVSPLVLWLGSKWLVEGAVELAGNWGVQDSIIGVSIVAIGTSLPELFAGFQAYKVGKTEIGIGNIVGSNVFNILAVVGVAGLVGGYPNNGGELDVVVSHFLPITIALSIFAIYLPKSKKGVFHQGWFLLLCYLAFLGWLPTSPGVS